MQRHPVKALSQRDELPEDAKYVLCVRQSLKRCRTNVAYTQFDFINTILF